MARTPNPKAAPTELIALPEQEIINNQNTMTMVNALLINKTEVIKQIGQLESLDFMRHVADVATAQIFENIKKSNNYKDLPYLDANGEQRHVADLEEFCQVFLKKSARRVRELTQNLHLLGPELYEQAEIIGFRARDYQALRALPPDEQEIVKQAIEAQDKDAAIELMQEMALKYSKEKEELKKEITNSKADYNALQKRNTDLSKEKEAISLKLNKYELKTIPMDERLEPLKAQIAETQSEIDTLFNDYRQFIELVNKLQFEAMENDPDYDPEASWHLPKPLETTLVMLNNAIALTLEQAKQMHGEIWRLFGEDLEPATSRIIEAESETRLGNM